MPRNSNIQPVDAPGRNLVLCCDGTSNQFGSENTSVVRLAQVLVRDARRQRLYYDPGVGAWWPAEFLPKLQQDPRSGRRRLRVNLGRRRFIQDGAVLHRSTLLRIRGRPYSPPNMSQEFLDKVRALADVQDTMLYHPTDEGNRREPETQPQPP